MVFVANWWVRNQGRLVWHQHIAGDKPTAFDLDAYAPTAGAGAKAAQSVTLRAVADSAFMDVNANGATNTTQRVKVVAGTEWLLNTSVLHNDVLATLATKRGQDTVNLVLAQGGMQYKMAVRKAGDTTLVNLAGTDMRFVHDAQGLKEATVGMNTTVRRVSAADVGKLGGKVSSEKLSYAAPAGAPYTAEDIVVNTDAGFQLAGTLTRPRGTAKVPLVITISGSGPQERDSRLGPVAGYALFRDIADTLGRRGVAVLRMDDRGVGASTGRETLPVATSADFANDVREVLKYARTRKDIDVTRIVLLGHSEGAMIAPMVASQDKGVRAVVLMAGAAYTGRRISMFQNQDLLAQVTAFTSAQRDSAMKLVPAALDSVARVNPWISFFLQHDPLKVARTLTQPVLILQGETDRQITPGASRHPVRRNARRRQFRGYRQKVSQHRPSVSGRQRRRRLRLHIAAGQTRAPYRAGCVSGLAQHHRALMLCGLCTADFKQLVSFCEQQFSDRMLILDVTSKPDTPLNLNVLNATHDSVTLAWTPGFDGGLKATYKIRYREASSNRYFYVDSLPNAHKLIVEGLKTNTVYLFSIMAMNNLGDSAWRPDLTKAQTRSE